MKRNLLFAVTLIAITIMTTAFSTKTVAAEPLPCTVTYLNEAKAQKAAADAALSSAWADYTNKLAAFNAVKDTGSALEIEVAASQMNNARDIVSWCTQRVNDAQTFVDTVMQKWQVEDNAYKATQALNDLNAVQYAKTNADNAQTIANAAAANLDAVKKQIAAYQQQLATSPSVQAQLNILLTQLPLLEADYQAKLLEASNKNQIYLNSLNSNYASYDKSAIDYIYNRDNMVKFIVTDLNNDGVVDGNDYFEGVKYMQNSNSEGGVLYNEKHWTQKAGN